MKRRLVMWLALLLLLLVVLWLAAIVRQPWYWRAAPASPQAGLPTEQRPQSALSVVFQPAVDLTNALIDSFRPGQWRQFGCARWPEWSFKLPWPCA